MGAHHAGALAVRTAGWLLVVNLNACRTNLELCGRRACRSVLKEVSDSLIGMSNLNLTRFSTKIEKIDNADIAQ